MEMLFIGKPLIKSKQANYSSAHFRVIFTSFPIAIQIEGNQREQSVNMNLSQIIVAGCPKGKILLCKKSSKVSVDG